MIPDSELQGNEEGDDDRRLLFTGLTLFFTNAVSLTNPVLVLPVVKVETIDITVVRTVSMQLLLRSWAWLLSKYGESPLRVPFILREPRARIRNTTTLLTLH